MLTPEEILRYKRQLVLKEIGGGGQQKLKAARVLVVGAGGLGSPLILYLAAAGIGTIGIVDDDRVALSNLQRQVLYASTDVGRQKVDSAAEAIARLNPHVGVEIHHTRLTAVNAGSLVSTYDLVADGSDNFVTRYAASDACYFARLPLITAAVSEFDASLTTLKPYELNANGQPNPTYRCLFPETAEQGTLPACAEVGILGALTGILGSMMALEVIREIVGGFGANQSDLVGRLLLIDVRTMRFETISYSWDPRNPLSGTLVSRDGIDY
jgi:molybdopterin/thiamine biosynthesis adenylyltransferase